MKHAPNVPMSPDEDWRHGGFGLYIHWPYCTSKCPYCDFNSHVSAAIDHDAWRTAYLREIERAATKTPGRVLNSIFFGGGTPSLMSPDTVRSVIALAKEQWQFANDIEITLEANPTSVEAAKLDAFCAAGVNRLSIGVQAFREHDLKRLGRRHSVAEAIKAVHTARAIFDRVSFDVIYARQDQSLDAWREELEEVLAMGPDHLSLYQLSIEDGTAFGALYAKNKLKGLPDEGLAADLYELTQDMCERAGLPGYEVSNHAKPGAESRHNLIYWRYGDFLGIGPGAHGRITQGGQRWATENPKSPDRWLRTSASIPGDPQYSRLVPLLEQSQEMLMMGLRLVEGINTERYRRLSSAALDQTAVAHLTELGLVTSTSGQLAVTPRGKPILNAILRELLS